MSKIRDTPGFSVFGIYDFLGAPDLDPRLLYSMYIPLLTLLESPAVAGRTSKKVSLVGKKDRGLPGHFSKKCPLSIKSALKWTFSRDSKSEVPLLAC
jgi:hypothetical protein